MTTKQCTKCGEEKALDAFQRQPKCKGGLNTRCRECMNAYVREYRMLNPHKQSVAYRKHHLKKHYGLTPDEYEALLMRQGGGCAVCGTTTPGGKGRFAIDHCHETGERRGLLCLGCNTGLGLFRDTPSLLEQAADYLRKNGR